MYLPAEAWEEDLTVLVFVPQLLRNTDEAGAGLRAVSRLQKWKTHIIIIIRNVFVKLSATSLSLSQDFFSL